MYYRIPEEFFLTVIKVDKSDILDYEEGVKNLKKDIGENDILKEADEEYLESEMFGKEKGCY
jgi:hypothetical protein